MESDPVVLALHAEITVDNHDTVNGEPQADALVIEGLVADIEHQVCIVWTYTPYRGIVERHRRAGATLHRV